MTVILLNELTSELSLPLKGGQQSLLLKVKKDKCDLQQNHPSPSYLVHINYNRNEHHISFNLLLKIATDMGDGESPCMRKNWSDKTWLHMT